MKVSVVLLTVSLLIASYNAALLTLDATNALSCISASGCTLGSSIFAGGSTPGANDDLVLNAGIFTALNPRVLVNVASGLTVNSIQVLGAGSQLVVQAGATLNTASNVTLGASTQFVVTGSATIKGVIAAADGTANSATTISISGSVMASGGINMAGSNTQLSVVAGASLTINAASTLRGTINWALNAAVVIQAGITSVYASFYASANVTVQSVLAVYSTTAANVIAIYQLNQGYLYLGASAVVNASVAASSSAVVRGTGTITGDLSLTIGATLSVGNSPGTQFVNGNYQQDSSSTFNLEIGSSSSYDKLVVSKNVAVNGILKCIQYNGYVPSKSESYTFITSLTGSVSGKYNLVVADPFLQTIKYSAGYNSNNVIAYYNSASTAVVSIMVLAIACIVSLF